MNMTYEEAGVNIDAGNELVKRISPKVHKTFSTNVLSGIGSFDSLLKIKNFDQLPYKIQKKIFFPLIESMDSLGFKKINSWP